MDNKKLYADLLGVFNETLMDGSDVNQGVADEDKSFISKQVKKFTDICQGEGEGIGYRKHKLRCCLELAWWLGFTNESPSREPKTIEEFADIFREMIYLSLDTVLDIASD